MHLKDLTVKAIPGNFLAVAIVVVTESDFYPNVISGMLTYGNLLFFCALCFPIEAIDSHEVLFFQIDSHEVLFFQIDSHEVLFFQIDSHEVQLTYSHMYKRYYLLIFKS